MKIREVRQIVAHGEYVDETLKALDASALNRQVRYYHKNNQETHQEADLKPNIGQVVTIDRKQWKVMGIAKDGTWQLYRATPKPRLYR